MKPNFLGVFGIAFGLVGFGLWICSVIEGQRVDEKLQDWSSKLQRVMDDVSNEEEKLKAESTRLAEERAELDKNLEEYRLLIARKES